MPTHQDGSAIAGTTVVVMRDSQEEYCELQDPYSETRMSFYSGLSVTTK